MLTQDRKHVYLLSNLEIDTNLKKHSEKTFKTLRAESGIIDIGGSGDIFIPSNSILSISRNSDNSWKNVWDGIPFPINRVYSSKKEKRIIELKIWFKSLFFKGKESPIIFF